MGRELFDYAFKEYCKRWAFKHPSPADFFRTMEDASGVDLDWFWRGWFYDIEPVDISLDSVRAYTVKAAETIPIKMDTIRFRGRENSMDDEFEHITKIRNKKSNLKFLVDTDTTLRDFYYYYKPLRDTASFFVRNEFANMKIPENEEMKKFENKFYYELHFTNKGGLVMPIIIQWNYKDGSSEVEYINAYIWRKNEHKVIKTFVKDKEVVSIKIDPYRETADIDETNNSWPKEIIPSKFDVYNAKNVGRGEGNENNPMQRALKKNENDRTK